VIIDGACDGADECAPRSPGCVAAALAAELVHKQQPGMELQRSSPPVAMVQLDMLGEVKGAFEEEGDAWKHGSCRRCYCCCCQDVTNKAARQQ
jgi:hypothetical protein